MKLPILKTHYVDASSFINCWSEQYEYENEHLYDDNIGKELTEARIWQLFHWKNGGPLSEKKQKSVKENYIKENIVIPSNTDASFLKTYLNRPGGAIWRIFWLHCNYPKKFPIYDQHVHRAMASLKGWKDIEIPSYNKKKIESYLKNYLPFWSLFSDYESKKVDKALWAYGRFLKFGYIFD